MENPKVEQFLKSKNLSIAKFSKKINYEKKHLGNVLARRSKASMRMVNAIIHASDGAFDVSDFILSDRELK